MNSSIQKKTPKEIGILWCNLGSPDSPTSSSVRKYLRQFLSDRRVVEIPLIVWLPILYGFVLWLRPKKSAQKYASIWTPEGSPLAVHHAKQALLLQGYLGSRSLFCRVGAGMRYGVPSIESVLNTYQKQNVQRLLILPAYPQYSATTTASAFDAVNRWLLRQRNAPEVRFVKSYQTHAQYIDAMAQQISTYWAKHGRGDKLVLSFHGLPVRNIALGDPYRAQCFETGEALIKKLALDTAHVEVCFQSRFGRAKWIEPWTEKTLKKLAKQGLQRVDVFCPGFVSDCLETLEEIAIQARQTFMLAGGKEFHYIPCLNDNPVWLEALADIAQMHLQGWSEE